jgi:hypothetical protein
MRRLHTVFFNRLKLDWAREFPFLRPIEVAETPMRPRGSNFVCDNFLRTRGHLYFFSVEIPPKRSEELTLEITISDSKERSRLEIGWRQDLLSLKPRTYRIGAFLNGKDFWWALADVNAKNSALMESLGAPAIGTSALQRANSWKPSSFDEPIETIVKEAVQDVNSKLRQHVFPKLHIDPSAIHCSVAEPI